MIYCGRCGKDISECWCVESKNEDYSDKDELQDEEERYDRKG